MFTMPGQKTQQTKKYNYGFVMPTVVTKQQKQPVKIPTINAPSAQSMVKSSIKKLGGIDSQIDTGLKEQDQYTKENDAFVNSPKYLKASASEKQKMLMDFDNKSKAKYKNLFSPKFQNYQQTAAQQKQENKGFFPNLADRLTEGVMTGAGLYANTPDVKANTGNGIVNTAADIVGNVAGFMGAPSPYGASQGSVMNTISNGIESKVPAAFTKNAFGRVVTAAGTNAAATAPISLMNNLFQSKSGKDLLKNTAEESLMMGAFAGGSKLLGESITALKNVLKKPVKEMVPSETIQLQKSVKPVSPKGTFKIANKELDSAWNEYNTAIDKIQNHFGTDQLRADEIKQIKPKLGIDLDSIITKIENAEKKSIPTAAESKLKRAAGVSSEQTYGLVDKLKNEAPELTTQAEKPSSNINTLPKGKRLVNGLQDVETPSEKSELNLQHFGGEAEAKPVEMGEGNINSARAKINYKPVKEKINFAQAADKIRTQFVDRYRPAEVLEKKITGKVNSAENSFYKQARLSEGTPERANAIIEKELKPIVKKIENTVNPNTGNKYSYKDLGLYAEAVHAKDVNAAGIKSGFTNAEVEDIINNLGSPEMEQARKDLVKYSRDRLKTLVQNGIISRSSYTDIVDKWKNYMPLNRAIEDDKVEFANAFKKSFANVGNPVQKLKGSEKNIIDPIESMVKNTYKIENATGRNRVGLELSKLAGKDAEQQFVRKLEPGEEVGRKNVVNVTENGEKVKYEVEPEVYKMMMDMNKQSSPLWIKAMSKPASVLRAGATLTPEFALRNPIRDVMNAFITSKSGFNPFTDFTTGLASYIKKGKWYDEFLENKGGYGNIISMDRQAHRKALERIIKTPVTSKFINIVNPKSWIELMRTISDATESATKIGEYRAAIKKAKVTPEEAAYRARDLMDFARSGSSIKELNKVVAFLNANIQGKSKFIRAIKENPVKVSSKLFLTMAVPSLGIYALNNKFASDEQKATIRDSPNWLRDSFWLAAIPGTDKIARIPKPFEGAPVSNGIERMLDYLKGHDKHAYDDFLSTQINEQGFPVMMTGIAPFIEGMTNHSFFRDAPIIPEREKYLQHKDQYDIYTSEVSKLIAGLVGKLNDNTNFASPRVIDNTIRGATGGLGSYALDVTDYVLGKNKPAKNITQMPLVKGFTVQENSTGKAVDFVYSQFDKLTKEKNSAKLNNKAFTKDGQLSYLKDITKTVSSLSSQIRDIQNGDLTPKEKRTKINKLAKQRNDIAREAMKQYREW